MVIALWAREAPRTGFTPMCQELNLGWTWGSEGKLDAKRGQIADWGMLIEG